MIIKTYDYDFDFEKVQFECESSERLVLSIHWFNSIFYFIFELNPVMIIIYAFA